MAFDKENSKDQKFYRVSLQVIRYEVNKGHLQWRISDISNRCHVSRGWIYKYLGNKKEDILLRAMEIILGEIFATDQRKLGDVEPMEIFSRADQIVIDCPEIFTLYLRFSNRENVFGKLVRDNERDFVENYLRPKYELQNDFQAYLFRLLIHGIGSGLFLEKEKSVSLMTFVFSPDFHQWLKTVPDGFQKR